MKSIPDHILEEKMKFSPCIGLKLDGCEPCYFGLETLVDAIDAVEAIASGINQLAAASKVDLSLSTSEIDILRDFLKYANELAIKGKEMNDVKQVDCLVIRRGLPFR